MSNTLITVVAFHYGRREKARLRQCVRYGLLYAAGLMLIVTVLFQLFAAPISGLFESLKDKDPSYYYSDVLIPNGKTLKDFIGG